MRRCSAEPLAVLIVLVASSLAAADKAVQFAGADTCRMCHSAENKGSPYRRWLGHEHQKAYEHLASGEAKKIAQARGVADPQHDKACLGCHVTAADAPAAAKGKKFDASQGVQCESCHGPGATHVTRRLEDLQNEDVTLIEIPKGEVVASPPLKVCQQCHNENSPTRKPFDYAAALKKISHLDPRKNRPSN